MNPKLKIILFFLVGAAAGIGMMYLIYNYKIEKREQYSRDHPKTQTENAPAHNEGVSARYENGSIETLTEEDRVVNFVKAKHDLPEYYISKSEAKRRGWEPSKGNLCDVLPGKAIGGDIFSNREKSLPKDAQYYEADVNYHCGNRGADRIVFTRKGDVWLTKNHYKSFEKQ